MTHSPQGLGSQGHKGAQVCPTGIQQVQLGQGKLFVDRSSSLAAGFAADIPRNVRLTYAGPEPGQMLTCRVRLARANLRRSGGSTIVEPTSSIRQRPTRPDTRLASAEAFSFVLQGLRVRTMQATNKPDTGGRKAARAFDWT